MSLFNELKRRNVFRVGIAYLVATWLLIQVTDIVFPRIGLPDSAVTLVIALLFIGFIPSLIFAWAFELTPEGLKKEKDVDRSQSITHKTGRKLDFFIIGILALAVVYLLTDKLWLQEPGPESLSQTPAEQATEPAVEIETLAPSTEHSIAVLPFANRSMRQEDLFFTDGIHDDLLTQLAKIDDLKVISRTSVMQYRDTTKPISMIAEELGVNRVLEGGVQRAGKRIRINAQLIDVETDRHLWAETFDREMTVENIFDIQSEITRQIVQAVRGELTVAEQQSMKEVPTESLEAYEAYLQARALANQADYAQENYIEAQPWAERAVEIDAEFSEAWAQLALIHARLLWIGYDTSVQRQDAALHALDMAKRFGPGNPVTLGAQAEIYYRIEHDFKAAQATYEAALQVLPGDTSLLNGLALSQRRNGHWEESIASFEQIVELDPSSGSAPTTMVNTLMMMSEFKRAEPLIDAWTVKFPSARDLGTEKVYLQIRRYGDLAKARKLFDDLKPYASEAYAFLAIFLPLLEKDYPAAITAFDIPEVQTMADNRGWFGTRGLNKGIAYQSMGDEQQAREQFQAAIREVESAPSAGPFLDYWEQMNLAWAYALLGENKKAMDISNRAMKLALASNDHVDIPEIEGFHVFVLARTGNREQALEAIERLLDTPQGLYRWDMNYDPFWDFFRDDERFTALIRPENLGEARE